MPSPLRRRSGSCRVWIAACLAALSLGACGESRNAEEGSDAARRRPLAPGERTATGTYEAYSELGYRLEWSGFPTIGPGERLKYLDVFDDIVVAQDSSSIISVLEYKNGQTRWVDQAAGKLTRMLGNLRDGNRLISSSETNALFYDVDTGNLEDNQRLDVVGNAKPLKAGPILIYGTANGQILGHLVLNGYRLWGNNLYSPIEVDPVFVAGTAALVSRTGDVIFVDPSRGSSTGRARMYDGPGAPVAVSEDLLFVASLDHSLYAISPQGGQVVWRLRTEHPLRSRPVHHDGVVYCHIPDEGLVALEATSGTRKWAAKEVKGYAIGMRAGRLLVWNAPEVVALDPRSGDVVTSVKLEEADFAFTDGFVDGTLMTANRRGTVEKWVPKF